MKTNVLIALTVLASIIIYMPSELQGVVFGRVVWGPLKVELIESIKKSLTPSEYRAPYIDYIPEIVDHGLPAPPLYGVIWALAGYFAYSASIYTDRVVFTAVVYAVQAILVLLFTVLTVRYLGDTKTRVLILVTLAFCSMYSIESLSLLPLVLSLLNAKRGDYSKSILYAGLATSISYFNFTLLVLLFFYTLREGYFNKKCGLMLLAGLLPYIAVYIVKPEYYVILLDRVLYRYYTPLSLYRVTSSIIGEEISYKISIALWLTMLVVTTALTPRRSERLLEHAYIVLLALYTLHPYAYPQTLLLVLIPGLLANRLQPERYYLLLELLNATTIILYLTSQSPLSLNDPAQWATQARNTLLLISTLEALSALYRIEE
jgi:hypothetical protein